MLGRISLLTTGQVPRASSWRISPRGAVLTLWKLSCPAGMEDWTVGLDSHPCPHFSWSPNAPKAAALFSGWKRIGLPKYPMKRTC